MGGWWRWALVSPDGVAPSRKVGVSAYVNLPLHHKVQKFSSGTGSPGWSGKKGRKTVVVWLWYSNSHILGESGLASCLSLPPTPLWKRTHDNKWNSLLYSLDIFPVIQPTVSKHWRKHKFRIIIYHHINLYFWKTLWYFSKMSIKQFKDTACNSQKWLPGPA